MVNWRSGNPVKYKKMLDRQGYWKVWLDNPRDAKKFLGIKKRKKDDFYVVEANLVNAIVLNDLSLVKLPHASIKEELLPKRLYPYQLADSIKMIEGVRILNLNRMGYGKTIEAIAALRAAGIRNAVVVAPKPILEQWKHQFDIWWHDHPEIAIVPNSPINGINLYNYEQIIIDKKLVLLRSRIWDAIVVDESHRIKTPNTKRTRAATSIPAKFRYALTGTPILKHPEDLFSQLRFLSPLYSGKSYYAFRDYFCDMKMGFFGEENKGLTKNTFRVDVLHKLLDIVAIRNPEKVLAQGKIEIIEKLGMQPKQRKLYKDIVQLILDELPEKANIPNGAVKAIRAQQATSCPSLFIEGVWGAKFEWIKMLLEDNPSEKIVVFSKFATAVQELQKYLSKNKIESRLYIGDMNVQDRAISRTDFHDDKTVRVLAGTIACIGEGVDGLQESSHICVFIDRPYSPEIKNQCEDRLNRPGQKEKVLCYFLECSGTYDRHYGRVNETRAEDIRRALQYDESDGA